MLSFLNRVTDPDAHAWANAVQSSGGFVTGDQRQRVARFMRSLKSGGVSLDRAWLTAAENTGQALRDVCARSLATAVAAPAFVPRQGFTGDGLASYIDTGFNPLTAGGRYTQDSASYGVYIRNSRTVGADYTVMGCASGPVSGFSPHWSDDVTYHYVNEATGGSPAAVPEVAGMWVLSRTGPSTAAIYHNGVLFNTIATSSTGLPPEPFYFCAINSGGAPDEFSADQIAFSFIGPGLSAGQAATLSRAVNTYMTSLGTNVY